MAQVFHQLHQNLFKDFKHQDIPLNLNQTQRRVLMYLFLDGEQIMSILCQKLDLEPGSMTSVVDSLQKLGLVERKRGNTDKRKHYIVLTSTGQNISEDLKNIANEYLQQKLTNLSNDDLELFHQALDQLDKINQLIMTNGG